jgi:hypothetical protein
MCALLVARLEALESLVQAGDESAWAAYLAAAQTLAALLPHTEPGAHGQLMTTAEMAARMNVSPKTLLRWRKNGNVPGKVHAERNGARGRAALRWRA